MSEGNNDGEGNQPRQPLHAVPGVRPLQTLSLEGNVAYNGKLFQQKWENYEIIANLQTQTREYRVALLLHTLGDEALKVYNSFTFPQGQPRQNV